ncbi:zinc finger protein 600-like isoform X2 [Aricia agestis]|nr:zinc finger protein 600-like isoform X2 [Aricia agestis]
MDDSLRDTTVFIDVTEGNAFSGLDNFAKDLHNENIEIVAKEQDQPELNDCPTEIKTEVINKEDSNDATIELKPEYTKTRSRGHSKTEKVRFRCTECNRYTAKDEDQLLRHIRKVHKGENPFQCYMCDYSTYNKILFEEHVYIHKGIKPYKCTFCNHKSVSKKNLKKHELIHRSDNPLKCSQCNYIARHQKGLAYHLRNFHSKLQGLVCLVCNKTFSTALDRANHISVQIKCNVCDYITCSKSLLDKHKLKHDNIKTFKKQTGLFQCVMCDWSGSLHRKFISKILLHLVHHPQTVDENLIDVSILRKHGIMNQFVVW